MGRFKIPECQRRKSAQYYLTAAERVLVDKYIMKIRGLTTKE